MCFGLTHFLSATGRAHLLSRSSRTSRRLTPYGLASVPKAYMAALYFPSVPMTSSASMIGRPSRRAPHLPSSCSEGSHHNLPLRKKDHTNRRCSRWIPAPSVRCKYVDRPLSAILWGSWITLTDLSVLLTCSPDCLFESDSCERDPKRSLKGECIAAFTAD